MAYVSSLGLNNLWPILLLKYINAVKMKVMNEEDNKTQSKQPGESSQDFQYVFIASPALGFDSRQSIFNM